MNRTLSYSEAMVQEASKFFGLHEIAGEQDNPIIVKMFEEIGHSWIKDDETAWCSCFINYVAMKVGACRSGKLNAKSWLHVGKQKTFPVPGDVVVFWREDPKSWQGHVGLFMGYNKNGDIFCLGGNQNNEVNISLYPGRQLLGFRTLIKA